MKIATKDLTLIAVFTAVMVIFSVISINIPISPVPITLSIFGVFLSTLLLGWQRGTLVQVIYVLLGLCGAPVFSNFGSGVQKVLGPTGGYIMSYILMAMVMGLLMEKLKVKGRFGMILVLLTGLAICYSLGTWWLMLQTHMSLQKALAAAIYPYIPLDLVKIAVSALLAYELKGRLFKLNLLPQA